MGPGGDAHRRRAGPRGQLRTCLAPTGSDGPATARGRLGRSHYAVTVIAPNDRVTSLARGIKILRVLSEAGIPLSLAAVAERTDSTRATARRLLLSLQHVGYVATDGPTFWLRPQLMELGDLYLDRLGLPALARQHLALLAERVRDTCSLTILDGDTVVYVDRVKASRLMTVNIAVGTRLPAFIMSSGRVLLADLPPEELEDYLRTLTPGRVAGCTRSFPEEIKGIIERARVDGFAIADQELDPTLRSIAAPVYADGRAVAAVNISTPVGRTSSRQLREEVLPELLQTTRAIGAELAVNSQIEH